MVSMGDINPTSMEAVKQYEAALLEANKNGTRVRAILLSSPHNPLGRPYDIVALEGYLRLCSKYNIHLISDEVYAKTIFPSQNTPKPAPFVSILSLEIEKFFDPALVHVLYGMSKDSCSSGARAGAIISPSNPQLIKVLGTVSSFTEASSMVEQAWLNILKDEEWLASYFQNLTAKMTAAYNSCAEVLTENNIPCSPVSTASFIWLDVSCYLRKDTAQAELELGWKMVKGGVWLGLGQTFHSEEHGNFRLTFATPEEEFKVGMDRLLAVLKGVAKESSSPTS